MINTTIYGMLDDHDHLNKQKSMKGRNIYE